MPQTFFETQTICLTGLPGSGKRRLRDALVEQFALKPNQLLLDRELTGSEAVTQIWCVIDTRTTLLTLQDAMVEQHLTSLVEKSDGIVFNFTEAADLDSQSFWSRWLRKQASDLPIVRVLNQRFPESWQGFESSKASKTSTPAFLQAENFRPANLQTFEFEVGSLHLEHLLMGLDSSKQSLGMQIWRVQAVVQTFEYVNLVAIEGTPNRWDTYAADPESVSGWIKIQGLGLKRAWLAEVIQASLLRA